MAPNWKYDSEPATLDEKLHSMYRSQIGSLNYFAQCTRPDIALAVGMLCRHLHNPNAACFKALKHLNCYLAHTPHLGLVYYSCDKQTLRAEIYEPNTNTKVLKNNNTNTDTPQTLDAFCDANWGGETVDGAKSTTGTLIYFGGSLISWTSKLQSTVALSTAESEHTAAFDTSRTVLYFRQFLEELGLKQDAPTTIFEDNTACIALSTQKSSQP